MSNEGLYNSQSSEIKALRAYYNWYKKDQKKIILKAKNGQLEKLEKSYWSVRDLGLTEVPENSLACVCLGIGTREDFKETVKKLQLL